MSPTYTVTAANAYYWQTLIVEANSADEARYRFREYLAAPAQQSEEEYEFKAQCDIVNSHNYVDDDGEPMPDRSEYHYQFADGDVEEKAAPEWIRPNSTVQMAESGGNG